MILKHRTKPDELIVLELLDKRSELSSKGMQYLFN